MEAVTKDMSALKLSQVNIPTAAEYEASKKYLPQCKESFWLRTHATDRGCMLVVDPGSAIFPFGERMDRENGVRPVVRFAADEGTELPDAGDNFTWKGIPMTMGADGCAYPDTVISKSPFLNATEYSRLMNNRDYTCPYRVDTEKDDEIIYGKSELQDVMTCWVKELEGEPLDMEPGLEGNTDISQDEDCL